MKKLFLLIGVFVFVGAGCFGLGELDVDVPDTGSPDIEATDDGASADIGPATSESGNITVTSPLRDDTVRSPLTVTGEALVFENVVDWRVLDADDSLLAEGFTTTNAPDVGEFGDFEARIFLPVIETDTFFLEVFSYSARDGSVQDLVRLELVPLDEGKTSVDVFFYDPLVTTSGGACDEVDFEKRTAHKTVNTAELALLELLEGPESEWASTALPDSLKLNSIEISEGVASVEFEGTLDVVGCRETTATAQIRQTLLQFPSIDIVEITFDS